MTFDESPLVRGFQGVRPQSRARFGLNIMDRDQIFTFVQDDHVTVHAGHLQRRATGLPVPQSIPSACRRTRSSASSMGVEDFSWDMIWDVGGEDRQRGWIRCRGVRFPFEQLRVSKRRQAPQTWGLEIGRSYPRSSRHRISRLSAGIAIAAACCVRSIRSRRSRRACERGRNLEFDPTLTASAHRRAVRVPRWRPRRGRWGSPIPV